MSEKTEEICVQRFLSWYNKQYKRHYVPQRAEAYFSHLAGGLNWDFVAYEVDKWFEFWISLCLDLTQALAAKGIQGRFRIIKTPVVDLKSKKRSKLLKVFCKVIADKESILKADEFTDIGPCIANKFANWPRQKIKTHTEYEIYHGEYRPSELLINKSPDSICEVTAANPSVALDGEKIHKKTFNEADIKHANEQLRLAKENGANKTILLYDCMPFIYPDLIASEVQNTDLKHISNIDLIYLVGTVSGEDIIDQIYSNQEKGRQRGAKPPLYKSSSPSPSKERGTKGVR